MASAQFIKGATYVYTNKEYKRWVGVKMRALYRINGTGSVRFTLLSVPSGLGYAVGDEVNFAMSSVRLDGGYAGWVKRMGL